MKLSKQVADEIMNYRPTYYARRLKVATKIASEVSRLERIKEAAEEYNNAVGDTHNPSEQLKELRDALDAAEER